MNSFRAGSSFQFKVVGILRSPRNHKSLIHVIWSSDVDVIVANYQSRHVSVGGKSDRTLSHDLLPVYQGPAVFCSTDLADAALIVLDVAARMSCGE